MNTTKSPFRTLAASEIKSILSLCKSKEPEEIAKQAFMAGAISSELRTRYEQKQPQSLENFPTMLEVFQAHKELEILGHQDIGLFCSSSVRLVIQEFIRRRNIQLSAGFSEVLLIAFNYGRIMGKREERHRRKNKNA